MVVALDKQLEAALNGQARREGISPEECVVKLLSARFTLADKRLAPRDERECDLLAAARPWGVSFSDAVLSSEGLYD